MKMKSRMMIIAGAVFLALAPIAGAQAAPQALGLVATYGNVDLNCDGTTCTADFTAFCLQQDRRSPTRGTAYLLANGDIQLAATTAAGRTVVLDARQSLRIESRRHHLAVRLSVPQQVLGGEVLTSVAVNVKYGVVLLPEAEIGDTNPHTQAEVAVLGEQMRAIGTSMVDANPGRMAAARILSDVINGLPERGRTNDLIRQKLLDDAIQRRGGAAPADAIERARGIHKLCRWLAGRGTPNMRHCLENQHDDMIQYLNGGYWRAAKPTI